VCTDTNRASEGYIPSFDPNMLVWNNFPGLLKHHVERDSEGRSQRHLPRRAFSTIEGMLIFKNGGTYTEFDLE
jgi:hypothetical protein